jgi:hypothetical protein
MTRYARNITVHVYRMSYHSSRVRYPSLSPLLLPLIGTCYISAAMPSLADNVGDDDIIWFSRELVMPETASVDGGGASLRTVHRHGCF